MAISAVIAFLIAYLVDTLSASPTCSYIDTYGRLHNLYCTSNLCCGHSYHKYCCNYTSVGTIVGSVIGFIIFVSIVSTICCCFCACCPGYRYRETRTYVVTTSPGPNYSSTATTAPYNAPAAGPPTSGPYTAKPAGAYNEPPPSYQV